MTVDTFESIDIGISKIEHILQIADVHIRLTKRHEEYREAFSKIYDYAKSMPPNSVIAVLGDLLHSKVDLSPEAVQLASEFLKTLSDLRPTILIAGNHDCLLTNKTRLDSLSPIVENLGHKNLYYLRETKLYGIANVLFNNMSVFDDATKYIKLKNVTKRILRQFDCKIALYHGSVHQAATDMGFAINNRCVTVETFDGHDIALLGDIHKAQTMYIDKEFTSDEYSTLFTSGEMDQWELLSNPTEDSPNYLMRKKNTVIRYSSSMIQQNHGESLRNHGFSVWDVSKRTFSHVEIPNDYGYFTIHIIDGKLVTDITPMPLKAKLRVVCKESVQTEVKRVITEIKKTHQVSDIIYVREDGGAAAGTTGAKRALNLSLIGSVDYQNKLIGAFLKDKVAEMDDDTIAEVYKINNELNLLITKEDQSRNIRWKPKRFEFDNMFSYGEGNVIDFGQLNDVYGLFAANASGKSSLMDALSFTIFDKSSKAFKAAHVMNSQKMSFRGLFVFEVNGVDYYIDRKGVRDKKGGVKVDVNFYKKDGEKDVPLNAEARRSTNEIIRDFLGTYDDFILTTLSLQGNQSSFVDMQQTERKELLGKFIGITIFDKLLAAANDRMKEVSGALKSFNKEDNTSKIASMELEIDLLTKKVVDLEQQDEELTQSIKQCNDDIALQSQTIVNLHDVPDTIDDLIVERDGLIKKIDTATPKLEAMRITLDELREQKRILEGEMDTVNKIPNLDEAVSKMKLLRKKFDDLNNRRTQLRTLVAEKLKKLEHLDKHEYDPNCKFCMNNIFVKDAQITRESLTEDKTQVAQLRGDLEEVESQIRHYTPMEESYGVRANLRVRDSELSAVISRKQMDVSSGLSLIEKMNSRITKINEQIDLHNKSKEILTKNAQATSVVNALRTKLKRMEETHRDRSRELTNTISRKVSLTDQIETIRCRIKEIESYEDKYSAYQYYLQAVGTSGVPYQIISEAVPQIEGEVNNILSQIVEFGMNIEMADGKNVVVHIKYEDRKWPLELCSGMEKFVAGLALRVALINISNLPRPNFMVVDEGFGALDADNMGTMHALFDFLKSHFDFLIIISHLDSMRDMVDKQLEIKKENGFSKIDNTQNTLT